MHVTFRESHGLEETDTPFDLGQDPADLVVLSYSEIPDDQAVKVIYNVEIEAKRD